MARKGTLTAQEAADALGVSRATLYAYVSRGLIRSEEGNESTRERRYHAEDVEKLAARKTYRSNPAQAAQDALHWGSPTLDSALTLIQDHRLYYRGHEVVDLARTARFEQVAALLWTGSLDESALFRDEDGSSPALTMRDVALERLSVIGRMSVAMALASSADVLAYDLSADVVARTGVRIVRLLAGAAETPPFKQHRSIAAGLAAHWNRLDAVRLIQAALILCADHELNASSFAARVAASAGANPYAVVQAGLAVLSGIKHGGNTFRVERFLNEAHDPARTVGEWMQQGERIPGFGHRLYPKGDPRAVALLDLLREHLPGSPVVAQVEELAGIMRDLKGIAPNIDLMLATLCRALDLPQGSPITLFAIGRSAGWIAHAIEQYAAGDLIRPRARYVGALPG